MSILISQIVILNSKVSKHPRDVRSRYALMTGLFFKYFFVCNTLFEPNVILHLEMLVGLSILLNHSNKFIELVQSFRTPSSVSSWSTPHICPMSSNYFTVILFFCNIGFSRIFIISVLDRLSINRINVSCQHHVEKCLSLIGIYSEARWLTRNWIRCLCLSLGSMNLHWGFVWAAKERAVSLG